MINDIYQDFSRRVAVIEAKRDAKLAALLQAADQDRLAQLRSDLGSSKE